MIVLLCSILLIPDQFPFGITPYAVGPIPGCALDLVLFSVLFRYNAFSLPQLTGDCPRILYPAMHLNQSTLTI